MKKVKGEGDFEQEKESTFLPRLTEFPPRFPRVSNKLNVTRERSVEVAPLSAAHNDPPPWKRLGVRYNALVKNIPLCESPGLRGALCQ